MPSLNNTTDGFNSGHPRRQYITTSAFNNDFYLYTVTRNPTTYVQTGTLSAVANATAANCPADRILRENGRRLYKDANPGISTLLVGVYDAVSGLSGLIDPNSARFAVYNGDKSVFQDNGVDPNGGTLDQGPPIYTRGTVTAGSGVTTVTGQVRAAAVTVLPTTATVNINPTLGQVFTLAQPSGQATTLTCTTTPVAGSLVYLVVTPAGTAAAITGTTNVKMASVTPTASKVTTIAFVSDGINLNQFGSAISA